MSFNLHPGGYAIDVPLPRAQRVNELVRGYLHGHTHRTRSAWQQDLDAWFRFCADFAVDVLIASRRIVVGYARYLGDVLGEPSEVVNSRLSTLSAFYDHALDVGAVNSNPVPW
jgi:hypothetical protein